MSISGETTESRFIRRFGRIVLLAFLFSVLSLTTILFYGHTQGVLIDLLTPALGSIAGRLLSFLVAGVLLGLLQAPIAIFLFGSKFGPVAALLSGIPMVVASLPTVDQLDSTTTVLLGLAGALACSVLAFAVVRVIARKYLVRDFVWFPDRTPPGADLSRSDGDRDRDRPGPMSVWAKLEEWVFFPRISFRAYVFVMTFVAGVPAFVLSFSGVVVGRSFFGTKDGLAETSLLEMDQFSWLETVVQAPVLETVLLALFLTVAGRLLRRAWVLAAVSAVLWGLLHGWTSPLWFLPAAWNFFVYSCSYLAWRRHSLTHAILAAAIPHALVNLTSVALTGS